MKRKGMETSCTQNVILWERGIEISPLLILCYVVLMVMGCSDCTYILHSHSNHVLISMLYYADAVADRNSEIFVCNILLLKCVLILIFCTLFCSCVSIKFSYSSISNSVVFERLMLMSIYRVYYTQCVP